MQGRKMTAFLMPLPIGVIAGHLKPGAEKPIEKIVTF